MLRIYEVMLAETREMRPVLARIEYRDRELGRQMRRAIASVILNLGEGMGSSGGHRRERYRSALGSAVETRSGLDAAVALGYIVPTENRLNLVIHTLRKLVG